MLGWYYSNPLNHADKVNSITILVSESSVLSFCELQVFFYSRCLDICDIWRQFYFVFIWDKCPFAPERDLNRHHVIPEAVIQPDSGPDVYNYHIICIYIYGIWIIWSESTYFTFFIILVLVLFFLQYCYVYYQYSCISTSTLFYDVFISSLSSVSYKLKCTIVTAIVILSSYFNRCIII